jgi:hypothetical protein
MITLDQHLKGLDLEEAKEEAIQLLAEQLSLGAMASVTEVCMASNYEFSYKNRNNLTNGNDEFHEMYCSIAKKLINSVDGL